MKSIILTDSQFEEFKQLVILETRSLKENIKHYKYKRDDYEKCGNFQEALNCSRILDPMYKNLERCYDLLFKLAQN